jgi:uncharacterized protein YdeI (YjbR/CyaY-like superfamily)
MSTQDWSRIERPHHPMPDAVRDALEERGLMEAYRARPAYQQNDYIGWITGARQPETQNRRLQQMLDELQHGGVYMRMEWRPR